MGGVLLGLVLLGVILLVRTPLEAQEPRLGTVPGWVLDRETRRPLAGAKPRGQGSR